MSTEFVPRTGEPAPPPGVVAPPFGDGERLVVAGDRPFLLHSADAWLVVDGQVDVFTVRLREGHVDGPRAHLLRVPRGQALFGVSDGARVEGWGLLAVSAGAARL